MTDVNEPTASRSPLGVKVILPIRGARDSFLALWPL